MSETEYEWITRMVAREEEIGPLFPLGSGGGVVAKHRRETCETCGASASVRCPECGAGLCDEHAAENVHDTAPATTTGGETPTDTRGSGHAGDTREPVPRCGDDPQS